MNAFFLINWNDVAPEISFHPNAFHELQSTLP